MSTGAEILKIKYREVLAGFEKHSFTADQVEQNEPDFALSLADSNACQTCAGDLCKTMINHRCNKPHWHNMQGRPCTDECYPLSMRGYYGLHYEGCRDYEKPSFAVHKCPGAEVRKKKLVEQMRARWCDK